MPPSCRTPGPTPLLHVRDLPFPASPPAPNSLLQTPCPARPVPSNPSREQCPPPNAPGMGRAGLVLDTVCPTCLCDHRPRGILPVTSVSVGLGLTPCPMLAKPAWPLWVEAPCDRPAPWAVVTQVCDTPAPPLLGTAPALAVEGSGASCLSPGPGRRGRVFRNLWPSQDWQKPPLREPWGALATGQPQVGRSAPARPHPCLPYTLGPVSHCPCPCHWTSKAL